MTDEENDPHEYGLIKGSELAEQIESAIAKLNGSENVCPHCMFVGIIASLLAKLRFNDNEGDLEQLTYQIADELHSSPDTREYLQ